MPAVLSRLFRDELVEAATAAIHDALGDAEREAIPTSKRPALISKLQAEALAWEREEHSAIDVALSSGMVIDPRGDADPRAYLQLADDLPRPRTEL
jgi:hypothetical protein